MTPQADDHDADAFVARAAEALEKRGFSEGMRCDVCGQSDWAVGQHLLAPPALADGVPLVTTATVYPLLLLLCTHCGHAHFFSALHLGLVAGTPAPVKEDTQV